MTSCDHGPPVLPRCTALSCNGPYSPLGVSGSDSQTMTSLTTEITPMRFRKPWDVRLDTAVSLCLDSRSAGAQAGGHGTRTRAEKPLEA